MNAQLEEFINQKKIEKIEEQKKEREELLISLGLVDKSKTTKVRKYYDFFVEGYTLDSDKNLWYKEIEVNPVIDITDEEYEELLKYTSTQNDKKEINTTSANAINTIAGILLALSIIATIAGILFCFDYKGYVIGIPLTIVGIFSCLYYPIIKGFSKIVAMAETYLQKQDK